MAVTGYIAGDSFIHKTDPRIKILLSLFFTLLVFLVSRPAAAAVMILGMLALWRAAQIPLRRILSYIKFLAVMVLFITLMQMLFGPGSRYIVKPLIPYGVPVIGGMGSLKWDGLVMGLVSGLRLLSLVLLLPLLTGTTSMQALAQGLTALRLNYRTAFIITSAINLIPALEEEARHIIDAQKLRGLRDFDEGRLWRKLKAYPALAVPLIISAMRRSQSMAYAMDSRAFGAFPGRTWREPLRMKTGDYAALGISAVFCGCVLCANFVLPVDFPWQ
jgi:energy-coupling factor transport system permease protein